MIKFRDLAKQQDIIRSKILKRIDSVLDCGQYILGKEVKEFEDMLVNKTHADIAVTCGDGTSALIIALMSHNIGPNDAVFLPSFTYNATANAILCVGATPIFVDVSADDYIIDTAALEESILNIKSSSTLTPKAIIAVDLFGAPANYPVLNTLAQEHNITLISDAAQSFGATLDGNPVGSLAPITTTSFFPAKALGGYGDGGSLFAHGHSTEITEEYTRKWGSIRYQGTDERRVESMVTGFNSRLDTLQAAILIEKLNIFYEELERCAEISAIYDNSLQDIVSLPKYKDNIRNNFSYYTLCTKNRDVIHESLLSQNIPNAIYYRIPLHRMRAFETYRPKQALPVCDYLAQHVLSLPIHPYLSNDEVHKICDAVILSVKEADRIK